MGGQGDLVALQSVLNGVKQQKLDRAPMFEHMTPSIINSNGTITKRYSDRVVKK